MPYGVEKLREYIRHAKDFDRVLQKIKILKMQNGNGTAELLIENEHTDDSGNLHGGLITMLVDHISSFALTTREDADCPHVSTNINVVFYEPAKIGDTVTIESKVFRVGDPMAFMEVILKNKNTESLVAKGGHSVFITQHHW